MINHPNLKEKLIKEICPSVEAVVSDIANGLTYETVSKFDFLHSCFYETLRKDPPVYLSLMQSFDADTKIGNIVFKKTICLPLTSKLCIMIPNSGKNLKSLFLKDLTIQAIGAKLQVEVFATV
jgi:hypothetical protein